MKKSNILVFALLAACSAFLLWLWYFLGFDRVDGPFDLVLSIVWWVVVAAAVAAVSKAEQIRRRRVRTVYVGERATFNSEKGLIPLVGAACVQDRAAAIIEGLTYGFTREEFPERGEFLPKYFIRTAAFKSGGQAGAVSDGRLTEAVLPAGYAQPEKWKGAVVVAGTGQTRAFDTPEGLAVILAQLEAGI